MAVMPELTPERARIFRITHIDNLPWILANGLHCGSSSLRDPNFVQIGNPDLIEKRPSRLVPIAPGGSLGDYIPFYFTPCSPMLLNIVTGYNGIKQRPKREIVIMVSSLHRLAAQGVRFVFSDRHAYLVPARFSSEVADLTTFVPWSKLQARNFQKRSADDRESSERYQAEALPHRHVPVSALSGIACHGSAEEATVRNLVQNAGIQLAVAAKPEWFF
jgi:hypothetical protein